MIPANVDATQAMLASQNYIADRSLATAVFLSLKLNRPLFLEGEAGVGKTEIAKVLATALNRELIRLQCYEGLDISSAVYEWNYPAQMLHIRAMEAGHAEVNNKSGAKNNGIYDPQYLIQRPLLRALQSPPQGLAPVLLIDELDRTDEPFEAFLLEILSDWQITIPEIGPIVAPQPPIVIVTSNRTREIHDAIKRRCLYYWVDYPSAERELDILQRKAPAVAQSLSLEIIDFVQSLRQQDLFKNPGIAETLDWAEALTQLDVVALDPAIVDDTLGVLLKYQDDIARLHGSEAAQIINQIKRHSATPRVTTE